MTTRRSTMTTLRLPFDVTTVTASARFTATFTFCELTIKIEIYLSTNVGRQFDKLVHLIKLTMIVRQSDIERKEQWIILQ